MSNDHYVPQAYLKRFIDNNKKGHVHCYSKSAQSCELVTPKSICHAFGGDSNSYFSNPRILDGILHKIEPRWNWAIKELKKANITGDVLLTIALNIARLRTCTPTRKRLAQSMIEADLEKMRPLLHKWVKNNPEQHEDADLLLNPNIGFSVDQSLGHAFAIKNMPKMGLIFAISDWSILTNNTSKPFITSDNPAILIDSLSDIGCPTTYIPLTPRHAALIHVNPKNPHIEDLLEFLKGKNITGSQFSEKMTEFSRKRFIENYEATDENVEKLNCEIVKHAENMIIANTEADWIKEIVKKYRNWKAETLIETVSRNPNGDEIYRIDERAVDMPDKMF